MKIKVFALAVAAMALTVACNNKPAEVEDTLVEDTMVIEEMVDEEVADSTTVAVAEEAAPAAKPAAKPVVKKEEAKVVNNADGTKTVEDKKVGRGSNEPTTSVTNNEDGTKTVKDKKVGRR